MAKGRMLLNRICESDKVNELSCDTARLLYTWLLSYLDRNGCFRAKPILVKNKIFPHREDIDKDDIENWLDEMENLGLIIRYYNNKYLFYPDFFEKQPKIQKDREGDSGIPEPTQEQIKSKSRPNPTQIKLSKVKLKEGKLIKGKPEKETQASKATLEEKKSPPKTDTKKESTSDYYSDQIDMLREKLYKAYWKKVHAWVNTMAKKKTKAKAIYFCLLRADEERPKDPWAYCEGILKTYNDSEIHKKDNVFLDIANKLKILST